MTDGIIQKVIRQYCIDIEINQAVTKKEKQFAISRISSLEQELIEEIKKITYHEQDIINCTCEHCLTVATISEILIGDNQE